ncbi:MAG: molybdopterin cofactor-binding domain-containing protein, partial [Dehalobacterium sp.]
ELAKAASLARCGAEVIGIGMYNVGFPLPDSKTKYGNCSVGYPFGAQVAEVEVDTTTGEVKVINFVAAQDVGKAINPMSVEGQIEGGIAQGIGYALMEEQIVVDGKIINPDWRDYKIPTSMDIPSVKVIIVESYEPKGPFGAKGAGEPPLVSTAPAIANAIFNAIGIRIKELPITSEKILTALKEKKEADVKGEEEKNCLGN